MSAKKSGARPRGKIDNHDIIGAGPSVVLKAGRYKVVDLSADLGVSEVTIRKSLGELDRQRSRAVPSRRGRAYSGDDIPFRINDRYVEKRSIAERIKSLHSLSVIKAHIVRGIRRPLSKSFFGISHAAPVCFHNPSGPESSPTRPCPLNTATSSKSITSASSRPKYIDNIPLFS